LRVRDSRWVAEETLGHLLVAPPRDEEGEELAAAFGAATTLPTHR